MGAAAAATTVTTTTALFLSMSLIVFPGGPGSAGNRISQFSILLELSMMELVVAAGVVRRAKLRTNCHQPQTNTHYDYDYNQDYDLRHFAICY